MSDESPMGGDRAGTVDAMNQMRQRALPIQQVAEAAGFQNEKSFVRAFQGWMGMTPGSGRGRADQPQQPPLACPEVGGHGAVPEAGLPHDVLALSGDDGDPITWLAAINPALISCFTGIVS